jgi:hypothetical protein
VYNNAQDGARFVGNDLTVIGCHMFNNGTTDVDGDCIQLLNCNNPYIANNVFDHSNSIYKQAFIHNRDDGLASGGLITNNIVSSGEYTKVDLFDVKSFYIGVPNVTCNQNYIRGGQYGAYLLADNINFFSNVVAQNANFETVGIAIRGSNINIQNNTVLAKTQTSLSLGIDHSLTTYTSVVIQNNLIVNYPVGVRTHTSGAIYDHNAFDICPVQNADINRTPKANGTGDVLAGVTYNSDYTPNAGSTVIGVGATAIPKQDKNKIAFKTIPTIGAYEYVAPRQARV